MSRLLFMLREIEEDLRGSPPSLHPGVENPKEKATGISGIFASFSVVGWVALGLVVLAVGNMFWSVWFSNLANAEAPTAGPVVAGSGNIQAVTDPVGAGILMDGHFIGMTPLRFDWEPGIHRLELKKYGYHDLVVDIHVEKGQRMEVDLKLYPDTQKESATTAEMSNDVRKAEVNSVDEVVRPAADAVKPTVAAVKPAAEVAKPKAWVVKPGQSEVRTPVPVVDMPQNGKDVDRVYTVDGAGSQKITGRVQEVARSEMPFRYTIQVGAFLDRESALKMAAFWHRKGYDAYLLELYGIKDPSRLWQSVRIGRFDSVVEGRRFLEQFRAKEKSDGYLASSDSFAPPKEMALTAGLGWDARKTAGKPQVSGVESQSKNKIGPVVPSDRKSPVDDPMVMAREAVVPTGEGHLENQGGGVKPTEETPVQSKDGVGEISSDSNGKDGDELSVEQVVGAGLDVKGEPMPAVTKSGSDLGPAVLSAKDGKPEGNDLATGAAPSVASPVEGLKVDLGQIAEKSTASQGQVPGKAENLSGPGRGDAQHLFDQAMREEKEGRMDDAQGLYRQILERDPGHVLARQRLARIYVEAGRTSEALALLKPAVAGRDSRSLASADPNFSAFLAALYQRQEEHWKAVDLYEALLQNDPNKGIWQMGMAISLEKLNEPANALRYYEKSLESGELSVRLRTFVEKRVRNLK